MGDCLLGCFRFDYECVCGYVLGVFVFLSVSVVPVCVVQYSPNPLSPPLVTLSSISPSPVHCSMTPSLPYIRHCLYPLLVDCIIDRRGRYRGPKTSMVTEYWTLHQHRSSEAIISSSVHHFPLECYRGSEWPDCRLNLGDWLPDRFIRVMRKLLCVVSSCWRANVLFPNEEGFWCWWRELRLWS